MAPRLTIASVFPGKGKRAVATETRHAPTGSFGLVADCRAEKTRIELSLPTPPSLNNTFVNGANGGRFKSEKYEGWLSEAGWMLAAQKPGRIAGPFEIDILIPRPSRRSDLDNRAKGLLDLLTKHRVIQDDSLAEKITMAWGVGDQARVVLTKAEGV